MSMDAVLLAEDGLFLSVDEGEVMLFAVRADGSGRRPIGSMPAGGLLIGAAPDFGAETILAVPTHPAALRRIDWPAAGEADIRFAAGLAAWIALLSRGIGEAVTDRPRPGQMLPDGRPTQPGRSGTVIAAHGQPVWLLIGEGHAELFGFQEIGGLVPFAAGAWLTLVEDGPIVTLPWLDGMARTDAAAAIGRFCAACAEALPVARGFADADELNRVRAQELAERQDQARIAARLAATVDGRAPAAIAPREGLIDIVRLVAQREGLAVRRPPRVALAQADVPPTLEEIARASGFRLQPVRLGDAWWRAGGEPLVGGFADGSGWVALLPARGRYDLVDEAGGRQRVDAALAARLARDAHAIVQVLPAKPPSLSDLLRFGGRGGGGDIATLALAMLAGSLFGQVLPRVTGFVFGELVPAGAVGAIVELGGVVLATGIAALLFQVALGAARLRLEARAGARVFAAAWDRVLSLPLQYLFARPPAELWAQAGAILSSQTGLRGHAVAAAAAVGALVSSLALILSQWPLAGIVVAGVVLVEIAVAALVAWRLGLSGSDEQAEGSADSMMFQMVGGIAKLRLAAAEGRASLRWAERFVVARQRRVRILRLNNLYDSWAAGFAILAAAALYAVLSSAATGAGGASSGYPVGAVMLVLSSFGIVLVSAGQLAHAALGAWTLRPSWTYARALLQIPPEPLAGRTDPGPLRGSLEVNRLAFRYRPDLPLVLRDVSFAVAPGQFVAVVGASGSGKSTLIRLILGLQAPATGTIHIDGRDVANLHPEAYRRQVGVVLQDTRLPAGSIRDVVRGATGADDAAVWNALEMAAMRDDVAAMPMGLHTLVTDEATTLSGGQQQRLALARVLLQRPAILLLDEATSALDGATQAAAMAGVLASPATRLVIAHRLSTIRQADLVLMLEDGQIVQAGRYDELIAVPGPFARLAAESGAIDPALVAIPPPATPSA